MKVYPREGAPGFPHQHDLITTVVTNGSAETDGLEVTSQAAGPTFSHGLLVKHDSPTASFALYAWENIAQGYLTVCPEVLGVPLSSADGGIEFRQNDPNPFRESTVLRFRLPREETVDLSVYNLTGTRVATLIEGRRAAGEQTVLFRPTHLRSGVYFFVLRAGSRRLTRRAVLMR